MEVVLSKAKYRQFDKRGIMNDVTQAGMKFQPGFKKCYGLGE